MSLLDWTHIHWFLTFWALIITYLIVYAILKTILNSHYMFYRFLIMRKHGYPPNYCEGDGTPKEGYDPYKHMDKRNFN